MTHQKVNVTKLVQRLKSAAGPAAPTQLAKRTKVDVTRISRFLNGEFKKMTPVLKQFCTNLGVQWKDLLDPPPSALAPELVATLHRIVGRDRKKIRATTQLLRSLEVLTEPRLRVTRDKK